MDSQAADLILVDVPFPERVVSCPKAKDGSGGPLRVRIRKLTAGEILLARGEVPEFNQKFLQEPDRVRRAQRWASLGAKQRATFLANHRAVGERLILAGAVDPAFYEGRNAPKERPVDEDGRPVRTAPLRALNDADVDFLSDAILEFEDGKEETANAAIAQAVASFPAERKEGSGDGEPLAAAVGTADAPA